MRRNFVVAIDGPAGSGKSTTARECARRLGFHYLDTGAMYRAVTLKVMEEANRARRHRVQGSSAGHLIRGRALARMLKGTTVRLAWQRGRLKVCLDGRDVTGEIRSPEVSALVSEVSAIPAVRRKMVAEQRRSAQGRDIVCEGRDIGSVVFPDAELKVFLDCDMRARAARRLAEMVEKGLVKTGGKTQKVKRRTGKGGLGGVMGNLRKRDRIDSSRRMSPLVRVPEAVLVDTTDLTIEEQVEIVCDLARRRQTQKV